MDKDWITHLNMLLERFSHLSVGVDMASLSEVEVWGLYCYLRGLEES